MYPAARAIRGARSKKTKLRDLHQKEEQFLAELEHSTHKTDILAKDAHLLEHLLSMGRDVQGAGIEITISGYDQISGTKKSFRKLYQRKHILVQKKFRRKWQN